MALQKNQTANNKVRLPRNMNEQKVFGITFDDILLTAIKNHMEYDKDNNPDYYTKDKDRWDKEVRLEVQKILGLRKSQFNSKLQELINQHYIEETDKEYLATNVYGSHHYYDLPKNTTMSILGPALKKDSIKVYVYLLGWYNYKKNTGERFTFSLKQLCEMCGIKPSGQSCARMGNILITLEQLALIRINPKKQNMVINGVENSFYVLDYATGELDLSSNGAAKASNIM